MSKGSSRRPSRISEAELATNWALAFGEDRVQMGGYKEGQPEREPASPPSGAGGISPPPKPSDSEREV